MGGARQESVGIQGLHSKDGSVRDIRSYQLISRLPLGMLEVNGMDWSSCTRHRGVDASAYNQLPKVPSRHVAK